ncbi:MAG: hypothetical protein ACI33S_05805 [Bacilli bacterium]
MRNKISKIITLIIVFTLFVSSIDALDVGSKVRIEKNGNTYVVVSVEDASDKCPIVDNPDEPDAFKVKSSYYDTIGYTYENTCQQGGQVCTESWTQAVRDIAIFDAINSAYDKNGPTYDSTGIDNNTDTGSGCVGCKALSNISDKYVSFNSSKYTLMKVNTTYQDYLNSIGNEYYSPDGTDDVLYGDYPVVSDTSLFTTNGGIAAAAAKLKNYGYRVVYFDKCVGQKSRTCRKWIPPECTSWGETKTGVPYCESWSTGYYDYITNYGLSVTKTMWPSTDNVDEVNLGDFFEREVKDPPECSGGYTQVGEVSEIGHCGEAWYRAKTRTCKWVCTKSGPSKVEVYGVRLVIDDVEAYCVTPSAGYNKSYAWDTTFDASKCKNSLQMYKIKDGKSVAEYDIDCGYAYILAEAKRLNNVIKEQIGIDNYFSYGAIDLAMKLFGTGITGNGTDLGTITGKEYLQSGGYYTRYYGYSGSHEYVGIPWIRDGIDRSSWPSIYRYFLPDFYSIYIRTARVARSYLRGNYRLADVGNVEKSNVSGNVLTETIVKDGKSVEMVIDPFEYLLPRECKVTFEDCNQSDTELSYNDKYSQSTLDLFIPMNGDTLDYLQDAGKNTTQCKNQSGLGVLCGLKNEKGNAEYLKSLYLYIRALQGNELKFEEKVEGSIEQYTPIDGLTKVLYEVGEDGEANTIIRYAIDPKVSTELISGEKEVDCDWTNEETKDQCIAQIFVYNSNGQLISQSDHYDYCKKNYCYYKIDSKKICNEDGVNTKITSIVVTPQSLKSTVIKKIDNGIKGQQTIFVYDVNSQLTGSFCQLIEAVKEDTSVKCPCNPKESPNLVEQTGNIDGTNYCSKSYEAYDELYYGDPSISTIINACYEEDKLKYDFTDDLNVNGNDIVYDAELNSRYSFQVKSDDFEVCKLYCRDETRFYIGNKLSVKAGQNLRYDIGQTLIDKKIINETAIDKGNLDSGNKNTEYNYMPSVVLQLRECTSEIDYKKWETLYNKATTTKEKNQLLYSIYNCNLYTTEDIRQKITAGKLKNIINENPSTYQSLNGYAEPAMIEYKYNTSDGNITIVNNYGTTKDYLLAQEGCTSLGLNQTDCAAYFLNYYSDDYYNSDSADNLGITLDFEHGLVDSNLNETIYCSGESCYKLKGSDGKYYYNPNAKNKNDYTTVDNIYDGSGNIVRYESGKILSYQEWGLNYKDYDKNSSNYKKKILDGNEVPTNEYASFIVVTETGFYNKQKYYSDSYSGIIRNEPNQDATIKSVELDKNIFPLHLDKQTGTYEISHTFNSIRTAYKRSTYYTEKNYSLFDKIDNKPGTVNFICEYDVYNTSTKYECESGNCKRELGFIYRAVDLNDVFESVTNESRQYPENWATSFAQTTLNQIQASSQNILEKDKNNDDNDSYLEYSYTLTPEGIKRIREYNQTKLTDGGYLDTSMYGCKYDDEEGIFYNCKSTFLSELESLNGKYDGLITVNKNDGVSEFCSNTYNEDKDYCKYQQKYETIDLSGGE